jgi:CheY-like chemotaxis protein
VGPCSILIIDDNADDAFLEKRIISKYRPDCIIEVASDGFQALERLRDGVLPALVFLDIKMPGIDGFEVLKFIRTHEQTRNIPVVMLTSSTLEKDIEASYKAGANLFLHKSLDSFVFTEHLMSAIKDWIGDSPAGRI